MPRNSSGIYTLPAGNPVAPNTLIETNWANPTLADVASSLTDSLDRLGRGTMLAPLKLFDGTVFSPALTFNSEATAGFYRPAASVIGVAIGGAEVARFTATGFETIGSTTTGPSTFVGAARFTPGPVGIGATAALATLTALLMLSANSTAFAGVVPAGTNLHVVGADGASNRVTVDSIGTPSIFQGRRANGTLAAPTAVALNDVVMTWGGGGHDGTAWPLNVAASISAVAAEAFTPTANGGYLSFLTTTKGGTALTEKLRLTDVGDLGLSVTPAPWDASLAAFDLNTRGLSLVGGVDTGSITVNSYFDGAWRYKGTSTFGASRTEFFDGTWVFSNAPPGTGGLPAAFVERLRIAANGRVGIGTTATPQAALHVAGASGGVSGTLSLSGTAGSSYFKLGNQDAGGAAGPVVILSANRVLQFGVGDSHTDPTGGAFTSYAQISAAGNVGIGTAPVTRLHVASGSAATITAERAIVPVAGQAVGGLELRGGSSASATAAQIYAAVISVAETTTVGTQNGSLIVNLSVAGAMTERLRVMAAGDLNIVGGRLRLAGNPTRYVHAQTNFAINTTFTIAVHFEPDNCYVVAECLTAEAGWAIGDRLQMIQVRAGYTGQFWNWYDVNSNTYQVRTANQAYQIPNKTSGAASAMTPANWRIVITLLYL